MALQGASRYVNSASFQNQIPLLISLLHSRKSCKDCRLQQQTRTPYLMTPSLSSWWRCRWFICYEREIKKNAKLSREQGLKTNEVHYQPVRMILNRKMQAFWELNFEDQCEGEEGEGEIAALVPPPAPTMPDEDFFSLICRLQVSFSWREFF